METKKQIRKEILSLRDGIPRDEHKNASEKIAKRLMELPAFAEAEQILLFASYGSEPDTNSLINRCMADGKKVFCPLVQGETMEFYEIKSQEDLTEGYKGIREPLPAEDRRYREGSKDFMVMPGAVFDRCGNRIGYGKGFYDRYLSGGFDGAKAAIAFALQIVENGRIPAEETDRKPDYIVTEQEVITWN